jgi:surface antigen
MQDIAKSRQREASELRANTPVFLLPLSSEPMSRETAVIITSTLNTALEMDGPRTPRTWKNPTTGSQGLVFAEAQKTSQYGSVCREFIVIMDSNGKRTGVKGNACRVAEEWKIPGSTPVEFKDGKIVENNEPTTAAPERSSSSNENRWVTIGSDSKRQWRVDAQSIRRDGEYMFASVSQILESETEYMLGGKQIQGIKKINQIIAVDCPKTQFSFPASAFVDAGGKVLYSTYAPRSKWPENMRPLRNSGDPLNGVIKMLCNR